MSVHEYALALSEAHQPIQDKLTELSIPSLLVKRIKNKKLKPLSIFTDFSKSNEVFDMVINSGSEKSVNFIVIIEPKASQGYIAFERMIANSFKSLWKKVVTIQNSSAVERLLHAVEVKAESDLILDANIIDNHISVTSCDFKSFYGPISDISALKDLKKEDLDFTIDKHGSYLHFASKDIHIDLGSIRYVWDKQYRKQEIANSVDRIKDFADRMQIFRRERSFTQSDFEGLSDKQIRRFENGEQVPTYSALEKISQSFDMSVEEYLQVLKSVAVK